MLGLPKSTEFNKRIPKQKFYQHLELTPAVKQNFAGQIKLIYWKNKIAASTVNIEKGKTVTEIEVFLLKLSDKTLDEQVLRTIDKQIPYHLLFILEYAGQYKAVIGYKEMAANGQAAFTVKRYFQTDWLSENQLPLHLEGLNLDAVYENFVRQIAGTALPTAKPQEALQDSVARQEKKAALKKQMAKLRIKIRKEKQLNRQMELNAQLKRIRKEWENV